MTFVGFARVSTKEQDLTAQIDALQRAGCDEIFHGKQSGASNDNDAKLDELVRYVRKGDVVVCTKLDRLGRSLRSILNTVDAIHDKGATMRTLDGAIDTSNNSPFSKAQISLLGTFAQLERDLIVSRTSEGREIAKQRGKVFGRPHRLNEDQRDQVIRLFKKGKSKNSLSKQFEVSRMTISRIVADVANT